ncbi:MAG: NAD(P)H-dependent oxidoreductase [Treponemataceae bacterium]|nr:NAD(P)H-dependent oxidoreductase [Treponemataceae bacterium]
MKRIFASLFLGGLIVMGASAKTLVVYYSYSDTANTRQIAEQIQKQLGADIAALEPAVPYSRDYDAVVDQAHRDVNRGYKPELKPLGVNLADYDTIIVGTPTWWYKMASPVLTFLSGSSFAKKNVALFSTHAGWAGTTVRDMEKLCSGANIIATAEIQFGTRAKAGSLVSPQSAIDDFIGKIRREQ